MVKIFNLIIILSLLAFADSSQTQNWNQFIVIGDAGVRSKATDYLRGILKQQNLSQIIMLGDNLYIPGQSYNYIWDVWKKDGFQFPLVAIGNHNSGYQKEVNYFNMPAEFYAKEFNGALFIVLNSDNKAIADKQIKWLDDVLSKTRYRMNFIIYHHPSVTLTSKHNWEERFDFQIRMRAIIKKYPNKITALMNGHDHAAGFYTLSGVPLILNGAAHEERQLSDPVAKDFGFNVIKGWGTHGGLWWSRLDYNSHQQEAWIHYFRFDKSTGESCSIRLLPRPLARGRNCQ